MSRYAVCVCLALSALSSTEGLPLHCVSVISAAGEGAGRFPRPGPSTEATSIPLNCEIGRLVWPNASRGRSHVVQFHKNHQSFTLCLTGHGPSSLATIYQLKGQSKMLIKKAEREGEEVCVQSQCNYVSLFFEVGAEQGKVVSSLDYTYSYALDHRCPRCSDSCLQVETCNADYMFIGTVQSSSFNGNSRYVSRVKIETFIRYNGTYQMAAVSESPCKLDQTTSNSAAYLHSFVPVQKRGVVVVHSHCFLRPEHRYMITADINVRLKNKGRLNLACAQEDVEYAQYHLNNLLRKGVCCA